MQNIRIITVIATVLFCTQDRQALTAEIAALPDSSLQSQVFVQVMEMKAENASMEDLLEASFISYLILSPLELI